MWRLIQLLVAAYIVRIIPVPRDISGYYVLQWGFFMTNDSDLFEIQLESGFDSRTGPSSNNASLLVQSPLRCPPTAELPQSLAFGCDSTFDQLCMTLSWPSAVGVTFVLYEGAWTAKCPCLCWLYTTTLLTIPYVSCTAFPEVTLKCCSWCCRPNLAWSRIDSASSLSSTIFAHLFYPAWKFAVPPIVLISS